MGSKGSQTSSTTSTQTRPDQQAYDLYSQLLQRAQGVANTPYQSFNGEMVAPVNAQQNMGISGVNNTANASQPWIGNSLGFAANSAQPITQAQIQGYMSPYTQSVVDATQNQFNSQNQQARQQLTSNEISQGALGGNRNGVAAANLAQAQQTAQAPVIAGLYNQSYNTGLSTALQEQQTGLNAGTSALQGGIAGAGAQLGAGAVQQQTQQAQDAANYQQFQLQQAFPYQQTQWLAGLGTGVGSQMGGTSNGYGTQTTPGPSGASQLLGGVASGAGILGATGAFGSAGWLAPLMLSDERVKENIEEVGRLKDGQRIYRYNYKGDPKTQIGLIAQEVERHHPEAVQQHEGLKMVDYDRATEDSAEGVAKRAAGGDVGMSGMPFGGVSGFIPNMNLTPGHGAPAAATPTFGQRPQQPDIASQMKNISGLAGSISEGLRNKPGQPTDLSPADPNTNWDAVGPQQVNWDNVGPQQDLGLDFGSGALYARGGVAGYAEGGAPEDDVVLPSSPENVGTDANALLSPAVKRAVAPPPPPPAPVKASGVAPASDTGPYLPVIKNMESGGNYEAVGPETTYKDGKKDHPYGAYGVMGRNIPEWTREAVGYAMTPEEFLRNPAAQDAVAKAKFGGYQEKYGPAGAAKAWFAGERGMNNPGARDVLGTSVAEYERRFNNGVGGGGAPERPGGVQGVGGTETPSSAKPSGIDWGANSKLWPSLMAAGFGMMASRSPHLGTAIGEGGLAGMQQYGAEQQREAQQRTQGLNERRVDLEAKRLEQQLAQKERELALHEMPYKGVMTAAEKLRASQENAKLEELRRQHDLSLRNPVKIGQNKQGIDLYALPRPNRDGSIDYYPIDPETRQVSPTPMGSGINAPQSSVQPPNGQQPEPQGGFQKAAFVPTAGGIVGDNQKLVSQGPVDYSEGAPYIEKGMEIPPPKETAGRSTQSIQQDAESFLQTGKLPPVRSGRSPVAVQQNNYRNAVQNYGAALAASRGLTPEQVANMWREAPGMLRFVMGADGRATVSLGTAVRHLETVREYANAWAAHDTQLINKIGAALSREFGSEAATNLEAVGKIVGPEIVKAIGVAGAGTEGERSAVEKQFSASASPAQIMGAITATQKLLAGQLEGKRRQAANAGVDERRFRSLIGEKPYEILSSLEKGGTQTPPPPAAGAPPAAPAAAPAKPTLAEFLAKAKAANPTASDQQLTDYYNKKYGGQ